MQTLSTTGAILFSATVLSSSWSSVMSYLESKTWHFFNTSINSQIQKISTLSSRIIYVFSPLSSLVQILRLLRLRLSLRHQCRWSYFGQRRSDWHSLNSSCLRSRFRCWWICACDRKTVRSCLYQTSRRPVDTHPYMFSPLPRRPRSSTRVSWRHWNAPRDCHRRGVGPGLGRRSCPLGICWT